MNKASTGYYFEDFSLGQLLEHATSRTITEADATSFSIACLSIAALAIGNEANKAADNAILVSNFFIIFHNLF